MCSWKGLLLLACAASLVLNVASDDVQVSGDAQVTSDTGSTGDTETTGATETGETGNTYNSGNTPDCTDSSYAPICKKDEVYTDCKNSGCTTYSCSELGFPLKCGENCKPGCVCKDSLLRAQNGTCIPRDQCPSCGGDTNAESGCGSYCINCDNYKTKPVACPLSCILNGCQCKNGFFYDRNIRKCVVPAECTPKCGLNEVFSSCTNGGCDARNCSQVGRPIPCIDPIKCNKGCVCANGYLRASNGTCVPKDQCGSPCGGDPNAKPGCGVNCGKTCSTYQSKSPICPRICKVNGCDCNDGFVYDANIGKCVVPTACTPTCGLNEVYNSCTNGGCDARNCSQVGKPVPCVKLDPKSCIKGCVCATDYLRTSNGTCVPKDQCGSSCGGDPNAKPGCGVNCGKTCSTYQSKSPICPRICKVNGCDCNDGFVYDANIGKCVVPTACTPTCGLNEVYNSCTNGGCDARNCSQVGKPVPCVKLDPKSCIKGCVCATDYLRASNGTCVPKDQCGSGCGGDPNAKPGCGVNCGRTCSTYKSKSPVCPLICKVNGCDCNDGFVYDANIGKCVVPTECTPTCGLYEVYSSCTNGGCDARNCSQVGKPKVCIDPIKCNQGCVCANGYLRASNGTCIPKDQCGSPACPGKNEYFDTCIQGCSNQTCDSIGKVYHCPIQTAVCKTGCRCNPGYYRNSNGECVEQSQCPQQCGQNEYFETCISGCSNQTCDDIGKIFNCPLQPAVCRTGCRCSPGFWRNKNNECIAESQCPNPPCPDGETYNRCPTVKCDGDYCPKTRNSPLTCPVGIVCDPPRCTCGFNQHRDRKSGKCIATASCPPFPCNGPNEEYNACPASCPGENCSDYINNTTCPRFRIGIVVPCQPQCKCKTGYFRNADGVCILGSQCAQTCGLNEVYSSCTNGGCDARNCSQVGKPVPCVKLDPKSCIKGCVCASGYLRASNGKCVPKDQCGPPKCTKPNEVYDVCPAPCPPRRCNVDDSTIRCAAPPKPGDPACQPGCRCADSYARNATGICVLRSQCEKPKKCNNPNEVYDSCPAVCPAQKCGVNPALILCAPSPTYGDAACQPGCVCVDGYVRNASNACIPKEKCPPECGKNEYFETCISGCSNQTCDDIGKRFNCPLQPAVCRTGCRCNPGFWRNKNNECIAENQCPKPPCPDGETYNRCPTVKCDGDYCPKTRNSPLTCPVGIVCDPPRCTCGFNQKRDRKSGKCVAIVDCPPFPCNGPNEEYQSCPAGCPGENCTDYINDSKCPPYRIGIVVPCQPKCKCKTGYFRNADGVCIIGYKCGPKKASSTTTTTSTPAPTGYSGNNGGNIDSEVTDLQAGITDFTGNFLYERMKASKGENIIISAFSLFTPVAQLALYATKTTLTQLLSLLNVKTKDEIRSAFPALTAYYAGQTNVSFLTAAKVYGSDKYPLSDGFLQDSVNVIHAEAQNCDFSKPTETANIINAWVESKTNNLIKNLVSPDMFDDMTRLVLVNAIYYKASWLYEFDKKFTKEADFYLNDGSTKKTKLMYQQGNFRYVEDSDLDCKIIELLYVNQNFSMIIALPNQNDGVLALAAKQRDRSYMDKAYANLRKEKVEVYIPPFEIETTTDLNDILTKLNYGAMFDSKKSEFTGLLQTPEPVYVSKAIQKAHIKTDETGSEAAAANAVTITTRALPLPPPMPKVFRADKPFLYYIRVGTVVLFSGVFFG